jgi:hypothetical protein
MRFERWSHTLRCSVTEIAGLLAGEPCDGALDADDRRTVAAAVDVARRPRRVAVVEQLAAEALPPVHIGWHDDGRALIVEADDDGLALTLTRIAELPTTLVALLAIEPACAAGDRRAIETTGADITEAGSRLASGRPASCAIDHLLRLATRTWRVTGGWAGSAADRTLTVIDAGQAGLWSVADVTTRPAAGEMIVRPETAGRVLAAIGDVITGRSIAPAGTR